MAQYALPDSDISQGTDLTLFTCPGSGEADYYSFIDEGFGAGRGSGSGPDDFTSFLQQTGNNGGDAATHVECGLSDVTDPASSSGHIIRARAGKWNGICSTTINAAGQQNDYILQLKEGSTVLATLTMVNVGAWTTGSYTLSAGEADAITNYSNLSLRGYKVEVGGGSGRDAGASAFEFECPDAGSPKSFPPYQPYRLVPQLMM